MLEAGTSSATTTTNSHYRDEILKRLEQRNNLIQPFVVIFNNYFSMADELYKSKLMQNTRHRIQTVDVSTVSSFEIQAIKEELANVYKLKSRNDQALIDANRKLAESEGRLSKVTDERDKLVADKTKLFTRLAELECCLKQVTEEKVSLYDEWLAINAMLKVKTEELATMKDEQLRLINKVRELNEQRASYMNNEVSIQEERQQRRIREEIAKACEDTSKDEKAISALQQALNAPAGDVLLDDVIPQCIQSKFEANDGEVNDVLWLSTEVFASAGSDKKVRIWRINNQGRQSKLSTLAGCNQAITRLDYEVENHLILGSSNDLAIRIWNNDNQRLISTFTGHTDKVSVARFHQTSKVVSGSYDRCIKLWDMKSQRCIRSFFPGSTILDMIGYSPLGTAAFISGHFDKKLRFWDGRSPEAAHVVEMAGKITSLDISSDGVYLLCSTRDDTLSLLDVRTYQILHIYSAEQYRTSCDVSRCVLSPGMEYCAAGSSDGHVFIWNVRTTKLEKVLGKGGNEHPVLSLAWNPCGRGLLSADKQKVVCLWA